MLGSILSKATSGQNDPLDMHIKSCTEDCFHCARWCELCVTECIQMDMPGMSHMTALCRDCAESCFMAIKFMSRKSPYFFMTCHVCAEICDACAIACEQQAIEHSDNDTFHNCAAACRQCAERCLEADALIKNAVEH